MHSRIHVLYWYVLMVLNAFMHSPRGCADSLLRRFVSFLLMLLLLLLAVVFSSVELVPWVRRCGQMCRLLCLVLSCLALPCRGRESAYYLRFFTVVVVAWHGRSPVMSLSRRPSGLSRANNRYELISIYNTIQQYQCGLVL